MFNSLIKRFQGNSVKVRKFNNLHGNSEIALLEFRGNIRNEIVKQFDSRLLVEGSPLKNGGKCSPTPILSLIGGGAGSLALSNLAAGSLFMATANPATLMTIGSGFGSAVMGSSGIIAQAPFIPVAGAIIPVIAPLLAFTTVQSIVMAKQFKAVESRLMEVQSTLCRILQREEATHIGTAVSAYHRLADIEEQFCISNQFSNGMLIRLSLLEDSINPLFERSHYLLKSQDVDKKLTGEDFTFRKWDARLAIFTSVLDMRIDRLRLCADIQENPGCVQNSLQKLSKKVSGYQAMYQSILTESKELQKISADLRKANEAMSWWQRTMPSWLFGKRDERKSNDTKSQQFNRESLEYQENLGKIAEVAQKFSKEMNGNFSQSGMMDLVYWQDDNGEHSYYTDDLKVHQNK